MVEAVIEDAGLLPVLVDILLGMVDDGVAVLVELGELVVGDVAEVVELKFVDVDEVDEVVELVEVLVDDGEVTDMVEVGNSVVMGTVIMVTVGVLLPVVGKGSVTGDDVEGFIVDDMILPVVLVIGSVTVE